MSLDYQKIPYLPNVLRGSLFLYVIALLTSMAGMEAFGWLTALCSLVLVFSQVKHINFVANDWALKLIDGSLILLLVVTILGAILNAPPEAKTMDVIGRARWMILYWLFLVAFGVGFSKRWKKSLLYTLIFLICLIAVYAIFQFYTGKDLIRGPTKELGSAVERGVRIVIRWRAVGFYGMSMTFGGALGITFAIAFGILLTSKKYTRTFWVSGVLTIATFVSSFLSYQRGVWLALAGTLFFMLMLRLRGKVRLVVLGVLIFSFATMYVSNTGFQRRLDSIFELQAASQQERIILWKANWEIFKDYPVIGVGYGENENVIAKYLKKIGEDESFRGHAHNNFLQFLSGTGGLGFLAYMLFSLLNLWVCWRGYRLSEPNSLVKGYFLGAIGAQLIIHIGGLTECSFKDAEVNHQYIFHLALSRYLLKNKVDS